MEENEFNCINVIPLVDVMLLLLTIVLTTSTFIATGAIAVSLPQASPARADTTEKQIITIDQNGVIYFNGVKVSIAELSTSIGDIDRNTPLLLRADKSIRLQIFMDVLDLLNNRAFKKATIQTERK